jgi:hypothetical protein
VVDEKATFVTFYTKKELVKINILLAVMYFLSLGILYINDLLVLLLKWLPYVNPISVNSSIYFLGFVFSLSFFVMVISSIWLYFWSADATLNIYDKLNVKYNNRDE